jgi:alpha-tubulin suppressor-like RCC1 family protein
MYNCQEINDNSWNEEFYKIFKECLKNETPIQKIIISNCHTMVINSKGRAYSWGWNNFGQCGIFPHLTKKSYVLPNLNRKKNEKYPILPVLNYKNPDKTLPIQNISNVSLNDDFSIIITQKGNAILFGDNSYGQLGQGHRMEVKSAQFLTRFKNKIKSLYTTGNMNLLLTKKNDLYLWYICENDNLIQPSFIYFPKKISIESISTGKNFAILLSSNGICYGIGSNEMGELGMKNVEFCENPQEITNLSQFNERIIQVRCGFKHTICLSINGKTYTWGNNSFGQLGHINNGNNLPCLINIEDKYERIKIIQIAAGFRSSFFMTYKGSIYYTGVINNEQKTMTPKQFEINNRNKDINESDFFPVKIWSTYSRNKTIFYVSFADIRNLKSRFYNIEKIRNITLSLAEKWIDDEITAPFIPHLAKYFESSFMRIEQKQK